MKYNTLLSLCRHTNCTSALYFILYFILPKIHWQFSKYYFFKFYRFRIISMFIVFTLQDQTNSVDSGLFFTHLEINLIKSQSVAYPGFFLVARKPPPTRPTITIHLNLRLLETSPRPTLDMPLSMSSPLWHNNYCLLKITRNGWAVESMMDSCSTIISLFQPATWLIYLTCARSMFLPRTGAMFMSSFCIHGNRHCSQVNKQLDLYEVYVFLVQHKCWFTSVEFMLPDQWSLCKLTATQIHDHSQSWEYTVDERCMCERWMLCRVAVPFVFQKKISVYYCIITKVWNE